MKKQVLFLTVFVLLLASACRPKTSQTQQEKQTEVATHSSIFEIVGDSTINADKLKQLCEQQQLCGQVYQWKNHLILFGSFPNLIETEQMIGTAYPNTTIKVYDKAFYEFNRKRCNDTTTVAAWDHTIMTANLVADTTMQKEYMDYHATQFENWPEVSNGFCNAGFQQLLVFRNGRQLMLVISIPQGESLDELDPKTTENNPRVDEWNAIMKNYQEGIEDAAPGETWVVFKN